MHSVYKTCGLCLIGLSAGIGLRSLSQLQKSENANAGHSKATIAPDAAAGPKSATLTEKSRSLDFKSKWQPEAEKWAAEDPAGFYHWLVSRGEASPSALSLLFRSWIKKDADAAFTALFDLPGDYGREELLGDMAGLLVNEPEGLQKLFPWLPRIEETLNGYGYPDGRWLEQGLPEKIAALLEKSASGNGISGAMFELLAKKWTKQDTAAALAWAKGLKGAAGASAMNGVISTWAELDPTAALKFLSTEATTGQLWNAFAPLKELAKTDPVKALTWWEEHWGAPDPNCVGHIFGEWMAKDRMKPLEYVQQMVDPILRGHCLAAWAGHAEPGEILSVLATLPAGPARQEFFKKAVQRLEIPHGTIGEPVAKAVRSLLENRTELGLPITVLPSLVRRLTSNDAPGTFQWSLGLPEAVRQDAAESVVVHWQDRVAAAKAISELPEGSLKQHLTGKLTETR